MTSYHCHPDGALLAVYLDRNDQDAFAALVARHTAMLRGVCRPVLGNHQDTEDAVQETFLLLARKAPRLRGQKTVAGWLRHVGRQVALNILRQRASRARREERASARRVRERTDRARALAQAHTFLAELPAEMGSPMSLKYLHGYTWAETAGILEESAPALIMRMRRFIRQAAW